MMVRQAHQPSWVGYVIKNLAVVAFVVGFVACGGDSGTSSAGSPTEPAESSSSVISSDGSSSSESVIPSVGSAGVEGSSGSSSSSSVTPNSSSVVLGSSSSVTPSDGSSSSVGGVSSSSVASSSSSASVVPSSSSVEGSSSSVSAVIPNSSSVPNDVESSSSVYEPYDHSRVLDGYVWEDGGYSTFVDPRTGRSYYYLTIAGRDTLAKDTSITVMAENLNIGEMVSSLEDQSDDSKIERYCQNNDTTYCDRYGGLYQWAEVMQLPSECNKISCADRIKPNHQGICPDGWRLFTYNDFVIVASYREYGTKDIRSASFLGLNTTGFSLVGAGYSWKYVLKSLNSATAFFYPEEETATIVHGGIVSSVDGGSTWSGSYLKTFGFSVRCTKLN